MENETQTERIQRSAHRIREKIRIIGAMGEIFQLFDGIDGPVKLEPDCLGVVGKLIVDRVPDVFEVLGELEDLVEGDGQEG